MSLIFFFSSRLELKKKFSKNLKKIFQYKLIEIFFPVLTEFFFFVLMDISKNQWRSTGGKGRCILLVKEKTNKPLLIGLVERGKLNLKLTIIL